MLIILVSTRYVHQFKKLNQMNLKGLMQSHFDCIWSLSFFFMKNKFYVVNELLAVDCFQDYSVKCIWFYVLHHDSVSHNTIGHIDGLVQERRNSSALAMELRLYCTDPLIYIVAFVKVWSRSWFEPQKFNPWTFQASYGMSVVSSLHKIFPVVTALLSLYLPMLVALEVVKMTMKCCYIDEIFVTGCIRSCQNDNFQCSQWENFYRYDDISILSM